MDKFQQSSILRLVLYTLITLLATLQDKISDLVGDSIAKFTWFDWLKLVIAVVLPTLVTIRAYIDQTLSQNASTEDQLAKDQIVFTKKTSKKRK